MEQRLNKSKQEIEEFIKECLGGHDFDVYERAGGLDEDWITIAKKEEPFTHIRFCFPKGTKFYLD